MICKWKFVKYSHIIRTHNDLYICKWEVTMDNINNQQQNPFLYGGVTEKKLGIEIDK